SPNRSGAARLRPGRSASVLRGRSITILRVKIVILGGTGFVGSYVVRRLSSEHDVTVFHRGVHESDAVAQVRHIHGEFAELSRCKAELIAGGVDVVLDMVPYIDKNGHGVRHFRGHADRAVVITSGDVYRAFARLWR